ncbi:MAG TPA: alkaline phosphatase family protein [Mycobacteriales bacterium]|nr:alkaline phosphatase family protein [Mycobacteriales bacterium]
MIDRSDDPATPGRSGISRRALLLGGAAAVAGAAAAGGVLGGETPSAAAAPAGLFTPDAPEVRAALQVLGKRTLRHPGSRPAPHLPAGTDTMPEIEHIVVLMMENHSYDNFLGMLGRGEGQRPRGDGFTIGKNGRPTATNPRPDGRTQHAFRMPTTCQLHQRPSNEWVSSHEQFNNGKMDGFVRAPVAPSIPLENGPVAMGYWTEHDLPFFYDLATHFPICDRFFCSLLGATHANRRFLIAGTSCGMTGDVETNPSELSSDVALVVPANGTIFDRLTLHGISWTDYCAEWPLGASAELYPLNDVLTAVQKKPLDAFFTDAAAGSLPGFSLIDPDFGTQSQENPQNIVVGEKLLQRVVDAVGRSPAWHKTILFITYDEHGGYYDHVPPPVALAPDLIPPLVKLKEPTYDGFRRYGFRVPAIVVSPYAKRDHVSSKVHDFGSILAFVERKWNLGALTYRDANANDLTDCLDLAAMRRREPTFPKLPAMRPANYTRAALKCGTTGPGQIPPEGSISGRRKSATSGP